MKTLLRNTLFYSFAVYLLPLFLPGVKINDDSLLTLLVIGFTLMLLYAVLRPILNILSLPLNLVTLGLFSVIVNSFILYILTVLVPSITISPFLFEGFSFAGFIVPKLSVNAFFAHVASAVAISAIMTFLNWLTE